MLIPHRLLAEDEPQARSEARARGWPLEDLPSPPITTAARLRQHVRQEMNRHSPTLAGRLRELASEAAFAQFDEIGAMQYVTEVPGEIPAVVSPYNVDSEVETAVANAADGVLARIRGRYRARRLLVTERRAARRADLVVCVSPHDAGHFAAAGAREVLVVPNGVDDELFSVPEQLPPQPRVLFFGSYLWPPNTVGLVRYLEEVWPRVLAQAPAAELRVAGPGPLGPVRAAAARTTGVRILGFVPDLLSELVAARLVIAPIWFGGGTRIKVLEALAAARPVVGTSVGVERIGFEHDCHGLVADDPGGLAAATARVLLDHGAASRYAHNGRLLAERYRWRALTSPLEERYGRLIARAGSAGSG
ncbi:MAG: glycosyltransferase [Solirubrobacterales bacterium]|nr:glycosyltransferase [Solirubrobacterales bacterium]